MKPTDTTVKLDLPISSDPALRRRFLVLNEPFPGNLRFGVLLEKLDWLAHDTALDYARRVHPEARAVTAAVDEILVRHVSNAQRDLVCSGRINRVGRTSMEIGIRVESESEPRHYASCYFTMVARDGDGPGAASIPVPPLEPEGALEERRAEKALERQQAWRARTAALLAPPSREEFEELRRLHAAQEADGFDGVRAGTTTIESWERTYPEQENESKVIFGGYIMRRAYELASICADRVTPHRPVIAAVNRVNFIHPVEIGDKLRFSSTVVYAEGPAVCVQTSIERMSRDRSVRALSNSCLFTFVNVAPDLTLRDAPTIHPVTYAEDGRWLDARRTLRDLESRLREPWLDLARLPGEGR